MRLITVAALLVPLALVVAGCGGDNLSLCDGCSTPTPEATLTATPTATPQTVPPQEIWEFCKPHLAAFKVPRYLEYRAELPKTPSSKVQKNILRDESKEARFQVFDRLAK